MQITNGPAAMLKYGLFAAFLMWNSTQSAWADNTEDLGLFDRYVDVSALEKDLKTRNIDKIITTMNEIKRMRYQGQILPYILSLWNSERDRHTDLPWDIVGSDIIRVELADILLQAVNNGFIDLDISQMHSFLVSNLGSTDLIVKRNSLLALAAIDDPSDVPAILNLAKQEEEGIFHAAVLTLAKMCNPAASAALDELEREISDPEWLAYLTSARQSLQDMKTHWCDQKNRARSN